MRLSSAIIKWKAALTILGKIDKISFSLVMLHDKFNVNICDDNAI